MCKERVAIRVSENGRNPNKIYFVCQNKKCSFSEWWKPSKNEYMPNNIQSYNDDNVDMLVEDMKQISKELMLIKENMQKYREGQNRMKIVMLMNFLFFLASICNMTVATIFKK